MKELEMGNERRSVRRYRCGGRVEIPQAFTKVPLLGVVLDVSEAGCGVCVPAGVEMEAGEECRLELKFQTSYLTFRAVGAVRSRGAGAAAGPMLGLEFVELNERGRRDIAEFIRDQETREREGRELEGRDWGSADLVRAA